MYDPCEYCIYASKIMDSIGYEYYQCDLDDIPDNYPNAECCKKGDDSNA